MPSKTENYAREMNITLYARNQYLRDCQSILATRDSGVETRDSRLETRDPDSLSFA